MIEENNIANKIALDKLSEAVKNLSEVDERYDDLFELLGVFVDDVADLFRASNSKEFNKQKSDVRTTFKIIKRKVDNLTFKNIKKV